MQVQIQALIAGGAVVGGEMPEGSNTGSNMEVAKPPVFNEEVGRVGEFITVYRKCYRMLWILTIFLFFYLMFLILY